MITVDEKNLTFKLDTPNTSYVFGVIDGKYLCHFYYGAKVSDTDLSFLLPDIRVPSLNKRDKLAFMDLAYFEYPTVGVGDYRPAALEIESDNGARVCELNYVNHKFIHGKPELKDLPATFGADTDSETLEITLEDKCAGVKVKLLYSVFEGIDAITRSAEVVNTGSERLYINNIMSTALDLRNESFNLLTLGGSWGREKNIEYRPVGRGFQGVSSERGISSAQEHPFIALTTPEITEDAGRVYGFNLIYSGNFEAMAKLDQFDGVRVRIGINPATFRYELKPSESLQSPEAVMVYSDAGLGRMTRTFHDLYRKHLIRSPYLHSKRPILINNWEATYFNFNTDKLIDIARQAAKSGIEMLVMDDGWFGNRFDDNRALGDWKVNEEKLQGGLARLVKEVNDLGLKFGIWMEPEMVCPDSDLYRAHPDWAIQVPGREPGLARTQLVLDITRPEVWDYCFSCIKETLGSANIEYLKWDMNRPLADVYSAGLPADRQGEFFHRYVLALYRMQEEVLKAFPKLLLENCSSGGGRYDPGMLYYSPQVWASDDTDAVERLKIQEGNMLIYPLSSIGAHVSDCPNHGTGRTTPFDTRGDVALFGTFGYELDITGISD
ncbi:MAG: alpha-galactosidase, partial [Lachnospiraceae bacterium]|nr:alpha-galactosidase [Lachnospiraceae bacterium]